MGPLPDARTAGAVFDRTQWEGLSGTTSWPLGDRAPQEDPMKVAIFGLGYVGTVTAAGLASRGHDVVGVDVDTLKVDTINRGQSPVVEPGIDTLVGEAVAAGRLQATTDARLALEGADVSLV